MDIGCTIAITVISLGITAMCLNYKAKFDKKSLSLEKNDREHQNKHALNEARIKELEKKNGSEQKQLDELKEEVKKLKEQKQTNKTWQN